MLVTDAKIVKNKGKKTEFVQTGYYMQGYLKNNLDGIPRFLKKSWDVVGIISGHGKVRIGKSTMAMQVAYYVAWILAGGKMLMDETGNKVLGIEKEAKDVKFNLEENVVFSADELQEAANNLHRKYGKNQVIVYDEGRQGLDSARTMESINKGMEDFFQECGFMGHVILLVLPSYFKLHEDYAVARSLFLIDVFADKDFNRGYFNFYNEKQKELLFFFGKKRLGATAKYMSANESFWGRFGRWLPFDQDLYEERKKHAIETKRVKRRERNLQMQRDCLLWLMHHKYKVKNKEISEEIFKAIEVAITESGMREMQSRIDSLIMKKSGY